ncbi:MAG: hypothetical protein JNM62_08465 [Flavobacteriales bacterium]|nr:hypothetical protein [Flavobacteriales bacterium]
MSKAITATLSMLCISAGELAAQAPPVNVQWSVLLATGSETNEPLRICVDQGITYWLMEDALGLWTQSDGVIRRYDANGMALTGYAPEAPSIGCNASLDHHIDFHVRNDSIWGISRVQNLGGSQAQDILFCAQSPDSTWRPDGSINGEFLSDGVNGLLVTAETRYLCAWHEVSPEQADGRVIAFDMNDALLWDVALPLVGFGAVHALAAAGDSLAVAAFPYLHWLQTSTGAHTSSTTLYSGDAGQGVLITAGNELYWAAESGGTVHYGKHDATGASVWSGTAPGITVNAIAVDAQGRTWIGGNGPTAGNLIKVLADGTLEGTYTFGATVADIDFSNGRLSWTGQLMTGDPSSYLINAIPQP